MPRPCLALLLAALSAACTTRTTPTLPPRAVSAVGAGSADIQTLVRLAITLDAAGDRSADTLYAPDAVVIANARVRLAAPRFAGIGGAGTGRVAITAANATVTARTAWVLVDYRWIAAAERRAETGRATVLYELQENGWKIVHAHSSQPLPWEP
jgi:ketosteroid isomerase-like protein